MDSLVGASSDPSFLAVTASLKQSFRNGLLAILLPDSQNNYLILVPVTIFLVQGKLSVCKWIDIEQFNFISTKWELIDEAAIHFQEFEIFSPHN